MCPPPIRRFLRKREVLSYQMPAIPCIGPPLSRSNSSSEEGDGGEGGIDVAVLHDLTDYVNVDGGGAATVAHPPESGRDVAKPDFSGVWLNTSTTVRIARQPK